MIEVVGRFKPVPGINRVRVYRNLHKDCWSVKDFDSSSPTYNRVIAHAKEVCIEDASFIVSEAGRQKVRRELKKAVHAYVQGVPCLGRSEISDFAEVSEVTYNPYRDEGFVGRLPKVKVLEADFVFLAFPDNGPKVWACYEKALNTASLPL